MKGLDPLYFVFDYSTTPSKEEQGWVYNQWGSEASEAVLSGEKRMICVCDLQSWQSSLPYWNSTRYPYVKWTDIKVDENKFIRNIGDYKFYVENGAVSYWERYWCPVFRYVNVLQRAPKCGPRVLGAPKFEQ